VSYNLRLLALLAVSVAALMLIPAASTAATSGSPLLVATNSSTAALPAQSSVPATSAASEHVDAGTQATEARILSTLKSDDIPMSHVFLPNFNAKVSTQGGVVSPLYSASPAPMGLGDFGIEDKSGKNVGTTTYTSSVEGSATLNAIDPLYVTSSAPDVVTIQLNTVATNVDLFGNTNYDFWIQNVPEYAAGSATLSFEDNIWNFSSPAFLFTANSIFSHGPDGVVDAPVLYFSGGPSFHVPTPFTVTTYNNLTVFQDRPTIYFNYTIVEASGRHISGSYDRVEFNSAVGHPTSRAPAPTFQINGKDVNPTGYLLNDAEIMLGGPGGGSTTTLFNIAGSMGLWLLPNGTSTYQAVPAAYDFGTDTGETSEGIAEYATPAGSAPLAILGSGPSLLYPLWGVAGAHRGAEKITVHLSPTNAFVFANVGKFNESAAAWAPTPIHGPAVYTLSPQIYAFKFLLSEYTAVTDLVYPSTMNVTLSITLASNPSLGVYTPLWAESNSQLAAISTPGGNGSPKNPYVLFNRQASIDPLFGELNDFEFQVFPGIYLIDTSAYVSVTNAPQFDLTYLLTQSSNLGLVSTGSPLSNDLNFELYNASHVSIVGSDAISGWFYNAGSFGDPASVYLWNSSYDLIAGNTFYVESNGITTSGGGHNTIWGNVFVPTIVPAANPVAVLNAGFTTSLNEFESNDLIYNNEFLTTQTATLFPVNFYTGAFELYMDKWNVNLQPASDVRTVNGWHLSGSILGLSTEGGNYWSNYGSASNPYGVLPYNNGGQITVGGDMLPLVPFALFHIRFHETGLTAGTVWSVTANGYTQSTNTTSMVFFEPNGVYAFLVNPVTGFTAHPASGAAVVNGAAVQEAIHFS
jgi:thermopsin